MDELGVNIVAILVAVIANFFVGFLWYSVLFGKAWATELGFDMSVKPTGAQMARGMIFMVIGQFLLAWVFAHNIAAWSFVPGTKEMGSVGTIMSSTIFTWLGFYIPQDLSGVAWEKHSWKLFAINAGYHFVTLLVASTILVLM